MRLPFKRPVLSALLVAACGVTETNGGAANEPSLTPVAQPDPVPLPGPAPTTPPADAGSPGAPAPAPAPVGVVINGTFVARDRVVVVLHIGHSNMAGRATRPSALRPFFYDTDPLLWSYARGGVWKPAKEPLSADSGTGSMAGPGMALLRTARSLAAPGTVVVSIGHGHSGQQGGTCKGYRRGGLLYDIVMKPALELRGKVTFGAVFTMLGITENHFDAETNKGFSDCMKGIADEMRADLGEPALPFMVGDFEREQRNARITPEFSSLIIAQLAMLPAKVARAAIIPTDKLSMQDEHHFDMTGHKVWAERGLQLLKDSGWAAWLRH